MNGSLNRPSGRRFRQYFFLSIKNLNMSGVLYKYQCDDIPTSDFTS